MRGILTVCRIELGRIFTLKPAFSVLILAILVYAAFYPQPYRAETFRDVPIALVDQDDTDSSRELARRIDASADVAIVETYPDQQTAQRGVYTRGLYGILVIPKNFERDLLHGRQSPIAIYADASYFLIYQRVSGAVTAVARTMGAEVETAILISQNVDPVLAAAAADPMPLTAVTLFNPQGGYATYILPAAFVLILQQTLLIGVGLLGTYPNPQLEAISFERIGSISRVLGKLLAYLVIETVVFSFYLLALPYLYDIPRLGSPGTIFLFALPFALAVGSLGLVAARIFRKPLVLQLVTAAIGMPFLFISGFSWPTEAIPPALHYVALALPSTSAINGLVDVAQLGASISDVRQHFLIVAGLAMVYGTLAVILERRPRS
ncbi:MAG: ABC transporter permease [Rhizobiaceae bacterium]|nr:ABC transporter permease [Rhizobiaceae bacterium]